MDFHTRIDGVERGVPDIIYSQGCSSHNNNLILKGSFGELSVEDIADGVMGEYLRRPEIIYKLHYPSGAVVTYTPDSAGRTISAVDSVRPVSALIEKEPVLSPGRLSLAEWLSSYYICPLFEALALFLPPGFVRKPVLAVS